MKKNHIIMFSSDDWGWKTSKYQLAIRFAKGNTVLFVSSVGFRSPKVSKQDLKRIFLKIKGFLKGVQHIQDGLYVLTPLIVPIRHNKTVDWINRFLLRVQLYFAKRRFHMICPYVFAFSQNWYNTVKDMTRKQLIYYSVDEHAAFGSVSGNKFKRLDEQIARIADIVFCTSTKLKQKYLKFNQRVFHISHGVNYALFSRVVFDPNLQSAPELADIPRPTLGFWGHISYDWVDAGLLKYLAEKRPEWTFLLIGKNSMEADEFENYKNIRLVGEKNFEDLPSYCKAIDVGLIPFVKSSLTDNCNPLKLYEYLAAGLPVVSTDIPEVRFWKDSVLIAKERENFLESCEMAMKLNSKEWKEKTSLSMKSNTWDQKVKDIYQIIQKESAFHK